MIYLYYIYIKIIFILKLFQSQFKLVIPLVIYKNITSTNLYNDPFDIPRNKLILFPQIFLFSHSILSLCYPKFSNHTNLQIVRLDTRTWKLRRLSISFILRFRSVTARLKKTRPTWNVVERAIQIEVAVFSTHIPLKQKLQCRMMELCGRKV